MSIEYTYTIINVDEVARCMEVVYSSEGNPTMHIGARLPYEGETLEEIIAMYAPVAHWDQLKLPVVVPVAGTQGVISPASSTQPGSAAEDTAFSPIFPTPASGSIDKTVFE